MATVEVTPRVLSWAREQAAMSREEAAEKLGEDVERLARWEEGGEDPTVSALSSMAGLYKRQLAVFFMTDPPPLVSLPDDYRLRTVSGGPARVSRDLVVAVRQARTWQSVIARLARAAPELVRPTAVPAAEPGDDVEEVAARIRSSLGVSHRVQLAWQGAGQALAGWRESVESLGVLVFAMRMDREVCRGFSLLPRAGPPVVALARESDQARVFTLMHEFCHLVRRSGGICSEFQDESARGVVERFCNRVAAGVLMPRGLVEQVVRRRWPNGLRRWSESDVGVLAQAMCVSAPAAALRLEELGFAQAGLYDEMMARPAPPFRAQKEGGGGGRHSWPGVRITERGSNYSLTLFEAWRRGAISRAEAARAMNMRPQYVSEIGESISRRRARVGF